MFDGGESRGFNPEDDMLSKAEKERNPFYGQDGIDDNGVIEMTAESNDEFEGSRKNIDERELNDEIDLTMASETANPFYGKDGLGEDDDIKKAA